MKTSMKAMSFASTLAVAGLLGMAAPAQAATVCATAPNGAQFCWDNGAGGQTPGTGYVGGGGSYTAAPAPTAPVYHAPAPAPAPVIRPNPAPAPVTVPAPIVQAPAPAPAPAPVTAPITAPAPVIPVTPVIPNKNEIPAQSANGGDVTPAVTSKEAKPSETAPPSKPKPETSAVAVPKVSSLPQVSSSAVPAVSTPEKSPAELSAAKASYSSTVNLPVLLSATLVIALLFGTALLKRSSFTRKFREESKLD